MKIKTYTCSFLEGESIQKAFKSLDSRASRDSSLEGARIYDIKDDIYGPSDLPEHSREGLIGEGLLVRKVIYEDGCPKKIKDEPSEKINKNKIRHEREFDRLVSELKKIPYSSEKRVQKAAKKITISTAAAYRLLSWKSVKASEIGSSD